MSFMVNSFQLPNELIDSGIMCDMAPNDLKCYLVIVRKTAGWHKEWDTVSITQLMELTGIKDKRTVFKSMENLEEYGLIESKKERGKTTQYKLKVVTKNVPSAKNDTSDKKCHLVVTKNATGTSDKKCHPTKDTTKYTIQKTKEKNTKKRIDKFSKEEIKQILEVIPEKIVENFLIYRAKIKAPVNTIKPLTMFASELKKISDAGFSIEDAIYAMESHEWKTVKLDWYLNFIPTTTRSKAQINTTDAIDRYFEQKVNIETIEAEVIE